MAFNKEKVMDAARKFVDKGQIDKAVKEYLRIVSEDPKDVRVWLKIGDLYAKKGSKQDAVETYLKVARFYHDQGFFLKAVAVYKQVLKLDPRLVDVILKLAELYRQLGLMSDAMQHFESVAAHFHREGNTKEALATVKKLVDLDPENIATRIKLAELYSKETLVDDAVAEFTVACEQLRRQGRQDDFVKVAERLLWHKPDNHALNRELAGLYLRRNDPRRALQKLQASFKADARDVETLGLLAQAFQALDQKAKTVSVLKELARIHTENKQRDKAVEVFRKIIEFVPTDADAREFLALDKPANGPPAQTMPQKPVSPAAPPASPKEPPVRAPTPPPVFTRTPTPLPVSLRAAAAKFSLTTDMPPVRDAAQRMTGSMPLIDEASLAGADFALPEYDGDDFSADMEPAPDPRQMSAGGELHAEEISKILAETDVYVKYGLHQKAVDHLRRVFGLDPDNVEAHERLKDILLSQGREQEAEVELLKLAELVASADPDRAELYLQDLLALNGTHTGAFDLARRYRLRVARTGSVSSQVRGYDTSSGGVAPIEVELDDHDLGHLDLAAPPRVAVGVARSQHARPAARAYEDAGHGRVAHGSPAGRQLPTPPAYEPTGATDFSRDFEPVPTRQMSPYQVEALNAQEHDNDGLIVDRPPARWSQQEALATRLNAQLDDDDLGDDIDSEVAAELARQHDEVEELPFDPDEARAFDAAVSPPQSGAEPPTGNDFDDALGVSGSYDPYGTGQATTDATAANVIDPGLHRGLEVDDLDDALDSDQVAQADPPVGGSLEDQLDEADFYIGQHMYPEAEAVLRDLQAHYPKHKLIALKLQEVQEVQEGLLAAADPLQGTDAIHLDELEELEGNDVESVDEVPSAPRRDSGRSPSVMLEHAVDEGDAATHFDLGLAYKEMGLFEEAVKAFDKAAGAPGREVSCRVMIGMCYREANNATEAVHQFKQALHADPSEREQQSIYYEIGVTYQTIGDNAEALYYFEMVAKRDPTFADAAARATALRAKGTASSHDSALDDDL